MELEDRAGDMSSLIPVRHFTMCLPHPGQGLCALVRQPCMLQHEGCLLRISSNDFDSHLNSRECTCTDIR